MSTTPQPSSRPVRSPTRCDDDLEEAVENDVLGVPAFLLAPGFAITGAQEVETFKMMLTRVHDRRS